MRISVCDDEKEMAIYIADLVKKSLPECNIEIFTLKIWINHAPAAAMAIGCI